MAVISKLEIDNDQELAVNMKKYPQGAQSQTWTKIVH